jgi:DNA (cytosine-5)-methyltransferase 1
MWQSIDETLVLHRCDESYQQRERRNVSLVLTRYIGALYKSHMDKKINRAIDLFCGCGGIAEGLRMSGYEVIAGLDINKKYIASFRHNFPSAKSITQSISDISPKSFADSLRLEPGALDMLAGGPPCQGFSKNVPRRHRYLEDPKNLLVLSFLEYAEFLKPRLILMENVAEMKNGFDGEYTEEVVSRLTHAGYNVSYAVLNAAEFGVPQRRRRAFFIASRDGYKLTAPEPTHSAKATSTLLFNQPSFVSVWEAIGDLPSLRHGEGHLESDYACPPFSEYQASMRNAHGKVKNHIARHLQPTQFDRLASLEPGQGNKDLPDNLRVKSGYSGAYGRLTKEMTAPTITRWVFHPGSGRYGHPVDTRVISIREVARIQGFPDSFEFVGSYTDQAGQLGNAVPPLLVKSILDDIEQQIMAQSRSRSSVSFSSDKRVSDEGNLKMRA